jgi:AcrR family transcriptional regulator
MDTRPKEATATQTLDAPDWVEAAFDALALGGIDAVRVDPLAKRLGVTRGSFYWHFKDRAALHTAMLREWRSRASYMIFNRLERSPKSAGERLERLLALPYSSPRSARGASIELAVRLWARRDKAAAKAVRHIDRVRLDYFTKLLTEHGLEADDARRRAFLFYATLMAEALIVMDDKDRAVRDWEKVLLGS